MTLPFKRLHAEAKLPTRANPGDAGYDLYAVESCVISPYSRRALVKTGLAVAIPDGHYGRVAPRSGLAVKNGLDILAGVIDSTYRGEIGVVIINHGFDPFHVKAGAKIAQLVIEQISTPNAEWVDDLPVTYRGAGGFGSTGN